MSLLIFLAKWDWLLQFVFILSLFCSGVVFPYLFKRWLLDRFDPEYQDFIERFTATAGDAYRTVIYCREIVAPKYTKYTPKPMRRAAGRWERVAAWTQMGSLYLCLACCMLHLIPFLTERLDIADLGLRYFGPRYKRSSGPQSMFVEYEFDYLKFLVHAPLQTRIFHLSLLAGGWFLLWLFFKVRGPSVKVAAFQKLKEDFRRKSRRPDQP